MILEWILRHYQWEAVWCPDAADPRILRNSSRIGACYVGTWTGPDCDLLCVRRCETLLEAEESLSPEGSSILGAALRAIWHRYRTRHIPSPLRHDAIPKQKSTSFSPQRHPKIPGSKPHCES